MNVPTNFDPSEKCQIGTIRNEHNERPSMVILLKLFACNYKTPYHILNYI